MSTPTVTEAEPQAKQGNPTEVKLQLEQRELEPPNVKYQRLIKTAFLVEDVREVATITLLTREEPIVTLPEGSYKFKWELGNPVSWEIEEGNLVRSNGKRVWIPTKQLQFIFENGTVRDINLGIRANNEEGWAYETGSQQTWDEVDRITEVLERAVTKPSNLRGAVSP